MVAPLIVKIAVCFLIYIVVVVILLTPFIAGKREDKVRGYDENSNNGKT
jgi:hypothetical protein